MACLAETGDLLIPIHERTFTQYSIYGALGKMITHRKEGRENYHENTVFKSVGLSIQYIPNAHFVHRKALEQKVGVESEF